LLSLWSLITSKKRWWLLSRSPHSLCFGLPFLFLGLFSLLPFPATTSAAQLTLAWDPSQDASLAGYRLYSGAQSRNYSGSQATGMVTSCTVKNLQDGQTYYFAVTAVDTSGLESGYSNEVAVTISSGAVTPVSPSDQPPTSAAADTTGTTPPDSGSGTALPASAGVDGGGGGGGGGGCFIATAAFGSYIDPHVMTLRAFRDSFLMTNQIGRSLVRWYYATSPAIADVIRESGALRAGVRLILLPAIGLAYLCLTVGLFPTLVVIAFVAAFLFLGIRNRRTIYRPIADHTKQR
jgi:hypothetical protein